MDVGPPVTPPPFDGVRDVPPNWLERVGHCLSRFRLPHFVVLTVVAGLVAVVWIPTRADPPPPAAGFYLAGFAATLLVAFGIVFRCRHGPPDEEHGDEPAQS
jgi:hypothetical protein